MTTNEEYEKAKREYALWNDRCIRLNIIFERWADRLKKHKTVWNFTVGALFYTAIAILLIPSALVVLVGGLVAIVAGLPALAVFGIFKALEWLLMRQLFNFILRKKWHQFLDLKKKCREKQSEAWDERERLWQEINKKEEQ